MQVRYRDARKKREQTPQSARKHLPTNRSQPLLATNPHLISLFLSAITPQIGEIGRKRLFSYLAFCYNNDMVSEPHAYKKF